MALLNGELRIKVREKERMESKGVTATMFLKLLVILEMYLELSYFLSQIFKVVTVTEVTKVPKFLI